MGRLVIVFSIAIILQNTSNAYHQVVLHIKITQKRGLQEKVDK